MVRILDEDEKDTHQVSTLGGSQTMKVINESGLYSAILKSKTTSESVQKWVTNKRSTSNSPQTWSIHDGKHIGKGIDKPRLSYTDCYQFKN